MSKAKHKVFRGFLISWILIASIVFTLFGLIGCGGNPDPEPSGPNTPETPEAKQYTVTWTAGEGVTDATGLPDSGSVNENTVLDFAVEPARIGYTFAGWKISGSDVVYKKDGEGNTTTYTVTADVTFAANWTATVYTITYNNCEGATNPNATVGSYTIADIPAEGLTLADASKTGYTFNGWYTAATGGEKVTGLPAGSTGDKVIYAQWSANKYTVTLDPNGGQFAEAGMNTVDVYFDSALNITVTPNHDTKVFVGWFTAAEGGEKVANGTIWKTADGATLYAHWADPVNTYFYINESDDDPANAYATKIIGKGEKAVAPQTKPSKQGFKFVGWALASDKETPVDVSQQTITEATSFYAVWSSSATVTVSFNANGGSGTQEPVIVTVGAEMTELPETTTFTRAGYEFDCWSTEPNGGNTVTKTTVCENVTDFPLYVKWKPKTLTITYNNTKEVPNANVTSFTVESPEITLSGLNNIQATSSSAGYKFKGWYDAATGGSKVETIATGTTDSVVLHAQWDTAYVVSYDKGVDAANAGSVTNMPSDDTLALENSTLTFTEEPTRTGYTFAGWKITGSDTVYKQNGEGNTHTYTVTANVTFTAQWESDLTVTFTLADGTTQNVVYAYNQKLNDKQTPTNTDANGFYIWKWKDSLNADVAADADVKTLCGAGTTATLTAVYHYELGTTNNNEGSYGEDIETPYPQVWTVNVGHSITFSGDMTSTAGRNYHTPMVFLYAQEASGAFRIDTALFGNNAWPDFYTGAYSDKEGWIIEEVTRPNYGNDDVDFRNVIAACTLEFTIDIVSNKTIFVTFKLNSSNNSLAVTEQVTKYKMTPKDDGNFAAQYKVQLGIKQSYFNITSFANHTHEYSNTDDHCSCGVFNPNHGNTANGGLAHSYGNASSSTPDLCVMCGALNPNHGDTASGGLEHSYDDNTHKCTICGAEDTSHTHSYTNYICSCGAIDRAGLGEDAPYTVSMVKKSGDAWDDPTTSTDGAVVLSEGAGDCVGFIEYNGGGWGPAFAVHIGSSNYRARIDNGKDCWGTWVKDNVTYTTYGNEPTVNGKHTYIAIRKGTTLTMILCFTPEGENEITFAKVFSYTVSSTDKVCIYLNGSGGVTRNNIVGYSSLDHNFDENGFCTHEGCKQINYAGFDAQLSAPVDMVNNCNDGWNGIYGGDNLPTAPSGNGVLKLTFDTQNTRAGVGVIIGNNAYKWRIFETGVDVWIDDAPDKTKDQANFDQTEKDAAITLGTQPGEFSHDGSVVAYFWRVGTRLYMNITYTDKDGGTTFARTVYKDGVSATDGMTAFITSNPVNVSNIKGYSMATA